MIRETHSICPKCYQTVPAITHGTVLEGVCEQHGHFSGKTETDHTFVDLVGYGRTEDIFNALMLNITNECNGTCPLCYYPCGEGHLDADAVLRLIESHPDRKIWLSGGEPTTHPDLHRLMAHPRVECVLTNGIRFADMGFFVKFLTHGYDSNGYIKAVISLQPSDMGEKLQALENARNLGVAFNCALFSIRSADEVAGVMQFWSEWEDVLLHARIRTPFCSWRQEAPKSLYLSDIYHALKECAPQFTITEKCGGNSIYNTNYTYAGRFLFTCCAPHVSAFDVDAVQYAPATVALDGKVYPIPMALVINSGIERGLL